MAVSRFMFPAHHWAHSAAGTTTSGTAGLWIPHCENPWTPQGNLQGKALEESTIELPCLGWKKRFSPMVPCRTTANLPQFCCSRWSMGFAHLYCLYMSLVLEVSPFPLSPLCWNNTWWPAPASSIGYCTLPCSSTAPCPQTIGSWPRTQPWALWSVSFVPDPFRMVNIINLHWNSSYRRPFLSFLCWAFCGMCVCVDLKWLSPRPTRVASEGDTLRR